VYLSPLQLPTTQTRHNLNRRRVAADGANEGCSLRMQINCPGPPKGVAWFLRFLIAATKWERLPIIAALVKTMPKGINDKAPCTLRKMGKVTK